MNIIDLLLGRRMQAGGGDGPVLPTLTNPAGAADILYGKEVINSRGGRLTGTMPDNGAFVGTVDEHTAGFTIPKGYHDGNGWVGTTLETLSVQPALGNQIYVPTPGHLYREVSVGSAQPIYDDGYTAGESAGYSSGYLDGTDHGYQEGYTVGESDGYISGEADGRTAGKQAEYDAFWDAFQNNGKRTDYKYGFSGIGWTDETFRPKYPIRVEGTATTMFRDSKISSTKVEIDFSKATNLQYCFYHAAVKHIGTVDASNLSSASYISYAFNYCVVETIDKLILATTTGTFTNLFAEANYLKNIVIEGKINRNGLNFQWSPLTHESLMSIINALEDYSADTSGTVWTISLGDKNLAKLTADEIDMIDQKGWQYG